MSDTVLRIFPRDPHFRADDDAVIRATEVARQRFAYGDDPVVAVHEMVVFVDCGENFEGMSCPKCSAELTHDWFGATMGELDETEFSELQVEMPCCGETASMNDVRFDYPQGFASTVVEIPNPRTTDPSEESIEAVGRALGCPVRWTVARY